MRKTTTLLSCLGAVILAACTSGSVVPPQDHTTTVPHVQRPLSARIEIPLSITAGSIVTARVVVQNSTGHALHEYGCGSPFAVVLGNDQIIPRVVWAMCLMPITIPVGTSSWPVTVLGSYSSCGPDGNPIRCDGQHRLPPLPPGAYEATLFQLHHLVPRPTPASVQVVSIGA
jgi:hypothetical protein